MDHVKRFLIIFFVSFTISCQGMVNPFGSKKSVDLKKRTLINKTAHIPPQCYAKTRDAQNKTHNPCYVCHTQSVPPNFTSDYGHQKNYSFPRPALTNPWKNLFEDRHFKMQSISDDEILHYIQQDNYKNSTGEIILSKKLLRPPPAWDVNGNGRWDGYIPDCYFNFDHMGFDKDPGGKDTGWRAFAYYPFPGTSWPTNGSTDDILIRLDKVFRDNLNGDYDRLVYRINLATVEAIIKRKNIAIEPVDEKIFGVDLDKDNRIGVARHISYDWKPDKDRTISFVGAAKIALAEGKIHLSSGLFPQGTEFLRSVRYIDADIRGTVQLSKRMKELRYMKKRTFRSHTDLEESALNEIKERKAFDDRIEMPMGNSEQGVKNKTGWVLQGFIEDKKGDLRPQSYEETVSCVGCHGGIGVTTDSVFGFPRKLERPFQKSWYHWSQKNLKGLPEPKVKILGNGVTYEYTYYLKNTSSGGEYQINQEILDKFYNGDGTLYTERCHKLHDDISQLLYPSYLRALALNKAYRTIVMDQDFHLGREATIEPVNSVHKKVAPDHSTGITSPTSIEKMVFQFTGRSLPPHNQAPLTYGDEMAGPDGSRYLWDSTGVIYKSRYHQSNPLIQTSFPKRSVLPTRMIVPTSNKKSCAVCHLIPSPATSPGKTMAPLLSSDLPSREKLSPKMYRLTRNQAQDQNGVWHPAGQRIAFVSNRSGSYQIWMMNRDGSGQMQLSKGHFHHGWPNFHPNGLYLVVWAYDPENAIYAIKTIGLYSGKEKTLVTGKERLARPIYNPKGKWIAYSKETKGNWDIWLVNTINGKTMRLTKDPIMESHPIWSGDGRALSYKSAPDPNKYHTANQHFMTFERGYATPRIHQLKGPASVQISDWSKDKKQILYTAEVVTEASGKDRLSYAAMISDIRFNDKKVEVINIQMLAKGSTLGDRGPVFSPDGKKAAFWAITTDQTAAIWLYDVKTGQTTQLTKRGMDMVPQWAPDGKSLLFESNVNGQMDLLLCKVP